MSGRGAIYGLLVAGLAVGCTPTQAWVPGTAWPPGEAGKSLPRPTDNESRSVGTVTRASGVGTRPITRSQAVWAQYTAVAADPVIEAGGTQPPAGPAPTPAIPQPRELPPVAADQMPLPGPTQPVGPHVRATPTATGGLLNLAPGEVAIDRVVELARQLAAAEDENRVLRARIQALEAAGLSREQAVAEMMRDVEAASAEVTATQNVLRSQRAEIAALKARLQQMELEDIENMKTLIELLEKLVRPAAGRSLGGGKEWP